jgi:hypothetical protein
VLAPQLGGLPAPQPSRLDAVYASCLRAGGPGSGVARAGLGIGEFAILVKVCVSLMAL